MKRVLDIIISALCLILFSPLMLLCFLAIKIGGGPAIYRQERIGLGGRPFYILKFRTMVVDAEKEGEELLQQENDPRLTKIGRFLRNHHLDELPQLWNVLVGDMAFVGPRPERKYYIDQIMKRDPRYERLYVLRPGVTSYATLKNGYTDTIDKMLVRLEMDLYYLEHQSLVTDMKILFMTFGKIVSGRIFILAACMLLSPAAEAQDSLRTHVSYDLTAETAVGTGDYTAYQLVTNRHHTLATRANTAYVRGAVSIEHAFSKDWKLTGAVDAIAAVHADHKAYLQQCYANVQWKHFFLEVGSREQQQVVRDNLLSIGSFIKGTNAKPIPQVHFGTDGFWDVPFTKQWVQIDFDFGYGKFIDSNYRKDVFQQSGNANYQYATGAYYHQKHLYIRSNPNKRFFVTVGIEHAAQFGGTNYSYIDGVLTPKEKPHNLKAFWKVILPIGDSNYFENNALEDWVYGNHIGVMTYQLGWNINKDHQLQVYLDNPFEDGSGVRKGNGFDGLWGMQYSNKAQGRQYVRGAVFEYFQSTNQSGPLHWDSGDYPEPARSQITDKVTGNDNYYNHGFYDSYAHYGMTPGIALITSPIYNKDGQSSYRDNRVKAWHVGINGELTDHLSYVVKGSYRQGWGTYNHPLPEKNHSFDAMVQGLYHQGPWQFGAAFAFDKGNIYGDCTTFNFKIGYHGKIL
ncbi:MAG: sugar transferase [Prevotella sp.]|nr:sugar transferase [Prevotella sp.]